jgi:hypothetical protein
MNDSGNMLQILAGTRYFQANSQNCDKQLFTSSHPSVCMEQLGPPLTDLMKFDILVFFSKSVKKIQVLLKYDKTNGYFT